MSRTSLSRRWRTAAAGAAIAAASFTMTACGEEEPLDEPGVEEVEEEPLEEEEED
ncbi:hypothetical protein FHU33_2028 [Blastococcus colisei]|uniref:Uncharacterized protein n=1 Tax=Blastococcus colisei TaxID=1564162 RepID=A0A543PEV8_9ACTN|nr:hypothetical protein [Blastococcus colisei]TQN42622.1 hypothetical protein FHU33_2028 [Blastococcus colisei]